MASRGIAQSTAAETSQKKQLTIEAIFAEGSLTGRAPETVKWGPDGSRVSFVQRDDSGDHGELWYVDAATGEKKILVSEAKLAMLSPPPEKIKDEREKERLTRYHVAAYSWAPDSKHLLFDSQGQLWLYDLNNGTSVQFTSAPEPSRSQSTRTKICLTAKWIGFMQKNSGCGAIISGRQITKILSSCR